MHLRPITCVSLISLLALGAFASERNIISEPPSFAAVTIVRAEISDLAVDAAGNKFLCGSAWGTNDFNPGEGQDLRGGEYANYMFLTRYDADGSYSWTATYEVAEGSSFASALTVADGTVYVTGGMYSWYDKNTDPNGKIMGGPYSAAIVVAFDAATGEIKTSFGNNGVAMYTGLGEVQAAGITAASGKIYVTGATNEPYSYEWDGNVPPDKDPNGGGNNSGGGGTNDGNPTKRCMPYFETNVHPFVWSLDAATGADSANFGAAGSVVLASVDNSAAASIAVADGQLFLTGAGNGYYAYPILAKPAYNDGSYFYYGGGQTFVAALNASTGAASNTFGTDGVIWINGLGAVTAHAVASDGSTVYVAGAYQDPVMIAGDDMNIALWPYYNSNSDAYVAAFDATTGAAKAGFGTDGMVRFGREFADEAWDIALAGGALYVTGAYGNRYDVNLYNWTYNNGEVKDPGGEIEGEEFWHYVNSHPDAFVLALNPATGAPNLNFSADGFETFGGTDFDFGRAIAISGGHVIVAGSFYSHNAALGGAVGEFDCGMLNGFILELDTATGGGGAVESNHPIYADAGPDQTVRMPEYGYSWNDGGVKGDPATGAFVPSAYVCFYARVVDDVLSYELTNPTVTWAVISAPENVELYDAHDPYVMVTLMTPGDYVFSFTATVGGATSTDTVTVHVIQNHAPVIDSEITATPANPKPGETVVFSVSAHDPDGGDISYSWMFGDSYECLYEATVKHTFDEPGTYDVSLFIYDGSDSLEKHYSITIEGAGPALTVDKMQFSFASTSSKSNGIKVSGKMTTPKNIEMYGKHVELSVGGGTVGFDLDEKGKGLNQEGSFALKVRGKKASFTAKLTGSDWKDALGMEDHGGGKMTVPVALKLGARTFNGSKDVNVSTKNSVTRGK